MQIDKDINILVVDDFSTMRMVVKHQLNELGFNHLDEAEDGASAWEKIQSQHYDLIVSDWNMPKMMGIDLLKNMRSDSHYKDIPFILITAEAKRSQIIEATMSGVDAYIVKPFNSATLFQKIYEVFHNRESHS